jgi:hypothetical protein
MCRSRRKVDKTVTAATSATISPALLLLSAGDLEKGDKTIDNDNVILLIFF